MSLQIIPCTPDRLPDMTRVMSVAIGRTIPLPRMRRKYLHGAGAGPGFGCLLSDKGRTVGAIGAIPSRFIAPGGGVLTGAQLCDFGLLPAYRGSGAFQKMVARMHEGIEERGLDFSFAFSSDGSRIAIERSIAHIPAGTLCCFEIRLSNRTGLLARAANRAQRALGWRGATGVTAPAPRAQGEQAFADRGADFVQARRENGIRFLQINGHAVMVRPGAVTSVALPETLDPSEVAPVLGELGRIARRAGTRVLRMMLSPGDPAFAAVEAIAGPSPGSFDLSISAVAPNLPAGGVSLGFADYENF